MRPSVRLAWLTATLLCAACGGQTAAADAGADAASGQDAGCYGDPRADAQRQCQSAADCTVVDRVADCCGSIVKEGIRGDQASTFESTQTADNTSCKVCKCPPSPAVDELGQLGSAFAASCDQGLCVAHAQ